MHCTNCGGKLARNESFCPSCGAPAPEGGRPSRAIWLWGAAFGLLAAATVALGVYAFELYRAGPQASTPPASERTAAPPPLVEERAEVAPPPPAPEPESPRPSRSAPEPQRASQPERASALPAPEPVTPVPAEPVAPPPPEPPPVVTTPEPQPDPPQEALIPERVVDAGVAQDEPSEPRPRSRILRPGSGATPDIRRPRDREGEAPAESTPRTAAAPSPRASPRSEPPAGPAAGDLYWTGKLDKNTIVLVEDGRANDGYLDGDALPGRPVALTTAAAGVEIVEAPGPENGWTRFSFRALKSSKGTATVNFRWRTE